MADARIVLAHRAALHHGVFTTDEALAAGMTIHQLERDVAAGRYVTIYKGVYADIAAPRSPELHQVAACKWAGRRAALSHRCALAEFDLADVKADRIELTTTERRCLDAPVVVHRTNYLPSHHLVRRDGRLFTDVPRALFDAGAVVRQRVVTRAVEEGIRRRLTTQKMLLARLIEHGGRGRRGCAALRKALVDLDPELEKTDSALEALMLRTVWSGDLPRPQVQYPVLVNGRTRRLDFAYPEILLNVEGDGFGKHGSHDGFEDDRERDAELELLGWMVLRFTWRQVRHKPEWVIDCIKRAHAQRSQTFFGN